MAYRFGEIINNKITDSTDNSKSLQFDSLDAASNTSTTFKFIQSIDRIITFPDETDTVVVSGDFRLKTPQLIEVKVTDAGIGEFTSIKDAVDSITDSSPTKPYIVRVNPGVYIENGTINVPQHTAVVGIDFRRCIVRASGSFTLFSMDNVTGLANLTVSTVTAPNYCIIANDSTFTYFYRLLIANCDFPLKINVTSFNSRYLCDGLIVSVDPPFSITDGITITDNNSGFTALAQIMNIVVKGEFNTFFKISGSLTQVFCQNISVIGSGIGICFNILDGASCLISNATIDNVHTGLMTGDLIPNNPMVEATGVLFTNTVRDFDITNPTTKGFYDGVSNFSRTIINPKSQFFIKGKDLRVITVGKTDEADFTSVYDAVQAVNPIITINTIFGSSTITSSGLFNASLDGVFLIASGIPSSTVVTYVDPNTMTISNPATATATVSAKFYKSYDDEHAYQILIFTGVFLEPPIILPEHTALVGLDEKICHINATDPSGVLITMSFHTSIRRVTIRGATNGIGILVDSVEQVNIANCTIADNNIQIKCTSTTSGSHTLIRDTLLTGASTYGIFVDGSLLNTVDEADIHTFSMYYDTSTGNSIATYITGPNAFAGISNLVVDGHGFPNITAFLIEDGAHVNVTGSSFFELGTGIFIPNTGSGPAIEFTGVAFHDNDVYDINIQHPNTTGMISVVADRAKVFIDPASTISVLYTNPVTNGTTLVGELIMGRNNAVAVDVSRLIEEEPGMGKIFGGVITSGIGLSVNVSAGYGYLEIDLPPNSILKKITWNDSIVSLPANSTSYVYLDSNGMLTSNILKPNTIQNILLGRVHTGPIDVEIIDLSPVDSHHSMNRFDNLQRDVYGSIFASGSIVIGNMSRELQIGSGRYYFSGNVFNPSGQNFPATFSVYYHDMGGNFVRVEGVTVVDNTQYDSGFGLVPLEDASGNDAYTKHSFYLVGDGVYEQYMLVYGQTFYTTLNDARNGNLPTPPNYFTEGIVIIASIIVYKGDNTFLEIRSERPLPAFSTTAISGSIDHGNLLGLLDDDHPQYLLVDGSRAMAGDFNMGGFDILNVDLVDGVDVSNHASRHLPNGADPITTAAPTVNLSATSVNFVGIANSLARSDHVHAINTGAPSSIIPDQTNATGTSSLLARADHIHDIHTSAPVTTLSAITTNATGTSGYFARSDHTHAILTGIVSTITPDQSNATGTSAALARADHIHNIPTSAPVTNLSATTINATGTSGFFARSDHTHAILTGIVSTITPDQSNATGTSEALARADHVHNIPTSAPVTNLSATTINATGTSGFFARSDHTHAINTGAPTIITPDQINMTGTSSLLARADHVHNIPTAAPITDLSAITTNSTGTSGYFARSDHTHAIITDIATTITPDLANATGTSAGLARADHIHNIPTAAPITSLSATTINATGTSGYFARSDHTHAILTSSPSTIIPDQTNATGTSDFLARADHIHNIPTSAPVTIIPDQTNSTGTSNTFARSDHVHNIPTSTPVVSLSATTINATGTSGYFARSDHTHAILTGIVSTITPDQANSTGTSDFLARADHIHNIPTSAPITNLSATTINATGTSGYFARSDHTHAIDTGAPTTITPDQINMTGTSSLLARADHVHNIPTSAPVTSLSATTANSTGTSGYFARSDHTHAILTGAPTTIIPDQVNTTGTSDFLARADHIHNIPTDAPVTSLSAITTNSEGTSGSFARNDHTHAILTGIVSTITPDQANATGASANLARADHIHNIPTAAPITSLSATTMNATGTSGTFARSDHTHAILTGIPSIITPDQANTTGTSSLLARADHIHNIPTATPVTIIPDQPNTTGTSNTFARSDHIHNIPTDAPVTSLSATTTNSEGTSGSFARNDHTHAILTGNVSAIIPDQANATGTSSFLARADHIHNIPTAAPTINLSATTTNTQGSAATFARSDHTHAIDTGAPTTIIPDQPNATGTSYLLARADHVHNIPTSLPVTNLSAITINATGTSGYFSRSDHTHAILTGIVSTITPDQLNATGTSSFLARADHIHNIPTAIPSTITPDQANATGTSANFARSDHIHNIPTAAPTTSLSATTTNATGTSGTFARSDHTHAILTGSPSTITPDQVNTTGTSAFLARADHIHNIPTDAPVTSLSATTTNAEGTSGSFARNDHTHAILTGIVSTITPDQANATGTSANLARADHIHNIPTAAPTTSLSATTTNSQGIASTFARSDHTHAILTGTPSTITPDQANATGTSSLLARADHIHNIPTDAPVTSLSATTTNSEGTSGSFARNDHTHAILTGAPSTITPDQTNATGASANLARADHIHNIPTATAVSIGTANTQGTATTFARSDHVHQGVHSIRGNTGAQRYGDITLQQGTNVTITDNGAGTFTISSTGGSGNGSLIYWNSGGNIGSASDVYLAYGGNTGNETITQIVITRSGTIRNLHAILTAAPGVGKSRIITLRLNGANTALSTTISNTATQGSNTVNTVSVAAFDLISLLISPVNSPANATAIVSVEFV